jgi:hypothetical protein
VNFDSKKYPDPNLAHGLNFMSKFGTRSEFHVSRTSVQQGGGGGASSRKKSTGSALARRSFRDGRPAYDRHARHPVTSRARWRASCASCGAIFAKTLEMPRQRPIWGSTLRRRREQRTQGRDRSPGDCVGHGASGKRLMLCSRTGARQACRTAITQERRPSGAFPRPAPSAHPHAGC